MNMSSNKKYSGFEIGSLLFGVLSILLCAWVYAALFCGAFGILFYFLGKKRDTAPSLPLRAGLICSVLGLVLAILLTAYAIRIIGMQSNGLHGIVEEIQRLLRRLTRQAAPIKLGG